MKEASFMKEFLKYCFSKDTDQGAFMVVYNGHEYGPYTLTTAKEFNAYENNDQGYIYDAETGEIFEQKRINKKIRYA